jgi:glutamate dehydrogenase (NAD(P)+)
VITRENAPRIKATLIVEAANAPTHPDADEVFAKAGQTVLPDILANSGGVTASYFEWVQNRQHYQWGLNRVRQELDAVLSEAFQRVWELSEQRKVTLRTAAYIIAVGRVGRATVLGGIS